MSYFWKIVSAGFVFLVLCFCFWVSEQTEGQALIKSHGYWDRFNRADAGKEPSAFAVQVLPRLPKDRLVLDAGCGSGRDALYFAENGVQVIACDISDRAVLFERKMENPTFIKADFTQPDALPDNLELGAIYSRFSIDQVARVGASHFLQWSYNHLLPGGALFLEGVSVQDPKYGQGQHLARDGFYGEYYRRFLRLEELSKELEALGFTLVEASEVVDTEGKIPHRSVRLIAVR